MSGRGGLREKNGKIKFRPSTPVEQLLTQRHDKIFMLDKRGVWKYAREPLHRDIDLSAAACGIGPGYAFAHSLMRLIDTANVSENTPQKIQRLDKMYSPEHPETTIGLVPCAEGGSSILEWGEGGFLYKRMIKRTRIAIEQGDKQVKGLLWFQGETDAKVEEDAVKYKGRLHDFIQRVRKDLGEEVVILLVAISGSIEDLPYQRLIRAATAEMRRIFKNILIVDSGKLSAVRTDIHLSGDAQYELGDQLAKMYFDRHVMLLP